MKIRALQLVGHKNTRPAALCVGTVPSLLARQVPTDPISATGSSDLMPACFRASWTMRALSASIRCLLWKAQDGCQNGQLWLGGPLCYSATAYARIMTGFLLESR